MAPKTDAARRVPPRRGRRLPNWTPSALAVVALAAVWQLGSAGEWWTRGIIATPREVFEAGPRLVESGAFRADLQATAISVLLAMMFGLVIGLVAGTLFWEAPLLGRVWEPYLISFYTVPLVVFYPIFLVVFGLGRSPIVILSTLMAAIPMTLNTWTGLQGVRPVHLNLARSLELSRLQTLRLVALPAAAPIVFAGVAMAVIYALIGVIAMEFLVAQEGLGHGIRYAYESFANGDMYFYILATMVLSVLIVAAVSFLPRVFGIKDGEA